MQYPQYAYPQRPGAAPMPTASGPSASAFAPAAAAQPPPAPFGPPPPPQGPGTVGLYSMASGSVTTLRLKYAEEMRVEPPVSARLCACALPMPYEKLHPSVPVCVGSLPVRG